MMKRTSSLVLVLEGSYKFIEPFNFSFLDINGSDIDLDYFYIEWFPLETNSLHGTDSSVSLLPKGPDSERLGNCCQISKGRLWMEKACFSRSHWWRNESEGS